MNNNLLHGTNVKFVNTVVLNRVDRLGELLAPSSRDVEVSESLLTLLQVQTLQVRVQGGRGQGVAFWNAGSNVHLVRRKFAEEAGWPGTETVLSLQTTRGRPQDWSTKVYPAKLIDKKGDEHELLMYSMDSITADLEKVDMGPAVVLFDNKVVEEQIRRPQGQVDQEIADLGSHIDPGGVAVSKQGYADGRIGDGGKDGVTDHLVKKEVRVNEWPFCDGTVAGIGALGGLKVKEMVRSGEQRTKVVELQNHRIRKTASLVDEKKLTKRDVVSIIDAPITIKNRILFQKLTKAGLDWD